MEAAVAWLVGQILDDARLWGWTKAKNLVFGSPFERALSAVTATALARAVATTLGPNATDEDCHLMEAIIDQVWPNVVAPVHQPPPPGINVRAITLLDRIRSSVAQAMKVATTPVLDLGSDYQPTTSLALLSDQIEMVIDEAIFTDALVTCWVEEVRLLALTNAAIQPAAEQVDHGESMERLDSLQAEVGRMIGRAVEVLTERMDQQATSRASVTGRWFDAHIEPIDAQVQAIYEDYSAGFQEAAAGLQTAVSAEGLIPKLQALRLRGLSSRLNAKALAIALGQTSLDEDLREAIVGYANGVLEFLHGADPARTQSWYSEYIERFTALLGEGGDPHDLDRYTTITLPPDPVAAICATLQLVVHDELPARYGAYRQAYQGLRLVCIPLMG